MLTRFLLISYGSLFLTVCSLHVLNKLYLNCKNAYKRSEVKAMEWRTLKRNFCDIDSEVFRQFPSPGWVLFFGDPIGFFRGVPLVNGRAFSELSEISLLLDRISPSIWNRIANHESEWVHPLRSGLCLTCPAFRALYAIFRIIQVQPTCRNNSKINKLLNI